MNPADHIYYKDGKVFVKYEHRTIDERERNYGTGTTQHWTEHKTGWEAVESLTNYCKTNGIKVQILGDDWKRYFSEMDAHEKYMQSTKPLKEDLEFCHPDNGSFMQSKFDKAYSEWQMMCSCDAPNKPGYFRANND